MYIRPLYWMASKSRSFIEERATATFPPWFRLLKAKHGNIIVMEGTGPEFLEQISKERNASPIVRDLVRE